MRMTLTLPDGVAQQLEERARVFGTTVELQAAELLSKALVDDEAQLLHEIRAERESLARRGAKLTDDLIRDAKAWGRK